MYTRREFGSLTLAGLVSPRLAAASGDAAAAVRLGAQSYSFRDLPRGPGGDSVDGVIKAFTEVGLSECELWAPQVEPQLGPPGGRGGAPATPELQAARAKAREELRAWRLQTPLDHFRDDQAEVRQSGHHDLRVQLQLQRHLQRRRDRPWLPDGERAWRGDHHRIDHRGRGETRGAVCRKASHGRGDARPLEHRRTRTSLPRRRALPRR